MGEICQNGDAWRSTSESINSRSRAWDGSPSPSPPHTERLGSIVQGVAAPPTGDAILPPVAVGQAQGIPAAAGAQAQAPPPQVGGLQPNCMLVWDVWEPTFLKAGFDKQLKKLAFILNQSWKHVEWYGAMYPDKSAYVNAITSNLENEVAEWVMYNVQ